MAGKRDEDEDEIDNDVSDDDHESDAADAEDNEEHPASEDTATGENPEPDHASNVPLSSSSPSANAPISDADKQAQITAWLTKNYGPASQNPEDIQTGFNQAADKTELQNAKERGGYLNNVSNFGHALETLGRANSMAHGGTGVDEKYWGGIKQQGQQEIQQAMMDRQANINQFLQENALKQQVAQNILARGDAEQRSQIFSWQKDRQDPTSAASRAMQSTFKQLWSKQLGDTDISGLSAAQLDDMSKQYEVKAKIDSVKATADLKATIAVEGVKNRKAQQDLAGQAKQDAVRRAAAVKDLRDLGADYDAQKASSRSGLGTAANKVNGATRVMSLVDVTPDDLNAAKSDPATKDALIKKFDQLTPELYTEVVSGLMTQVAPGAGSFGQLEHMRAETMSQGSAKLKQYFTSNPTPAGMGKMIFNNMMTLKNERDTSQKVIDDHNALMAKKHPFAFSDKDPEIKGYAEEMRDSFLKKAAEPEISPPKDVPSGTPPNSTKNIGGVPFYKVPGGWSKTPMIQTVGQ